MSRPRRGRQSAPDLTPAAWAALTDTILPDGSNEWDAFDLLDWQTTGRSSRTDTPLPPLADLWAEHGDDILAAWIADRPGTRPACFWRFDAPEPPALTDPPTGMPADADGESQAQYLARHGLLTPAELAALNG